MELMKNFEINHFSFGIENKKPNRCQFRLISQHDNLRVETGRNGISALIDKGVLLRNHIVKYTPNHYMYYVEDILMNQKGLFINLLRRKFEEENIQKSLVYQKIALSNYFPREKEEIEKILFPIAQPLRRHRNNSAFREYPSNPILDSIEEDSIEDIYPIVPPLPIPLSFSDRLYSQEELGMSVQYYDNFLNYIGCYNRAVGFSAKTAAAFLIIEHLINHRLGTIGSTYDKLSRLILFWEGKQQEAERGIYPIIADENSSPQEVAVDPSRYQIRWDTNMSRWNLNPIQPPNIPVPTLNATVVCYSNCSNNPPF
jgi:hypothetical protein